MGERIGLLQGLRINGSPLPASPREYFARLPVLDTPRLQLRPVSMRDAADIFAYSRDPEVARYVLWEPHRTLSDSKAYIRFLHKQYRDGLPSSWGIVLKATGRVVGTIGYMSYCEENSTVEIGYSLARSLWNNDLMTEAVRAVIDFTFDRMRLHRIEAQHDAANPASGRVMAKCGMRLEGRLRGRIYNKGRFVDVDLYAILRDDWLRAPERSRY